MQSAPRRRARAFIISGFAVLTIGTIITFYQLVTSAHYFSNASGLADFESVIVLVASFVTLWSWWWLSKIRVATDDQSSFARKGFYGLAVQNVLSAAVVLAVIFDLPAFDRSSWYVAPRWAAMWGSLTISIGFVLLGREFAPDVEDSHDEIENEVNAAIP